MFWNNKNNYSNKLKEVENNQKIKIHMYGFIWDVVCINNLPSQEKMFISYFYRNGEKLEKVICYTGDELKDFDVLNIYEAKRAPK